MLIYQFRYWRFCCFLSFLLPFFLTLSNCSEPVYPTHIADNSDGDTDPGLDEPQQDICNGCLLDNICIDQNDNHPEHLCLKCIYTSKGYTWETDQGYSICRPSVGVCDKEEICDGVSKDCPDDSYFDESYKCRSSNGKCDREEYCTGDSWLCPADTFAEGEICRESTSVCDVPEYCIGDSPHCPDDLFEVDKVCREAAGLCDKEEFCTGESPECPPDGFLTRNTVCRVAKGQCDKVEFCTGSRSDCPYDQVADYGTTCDDHNSCTENEFCDGFGKGSHHCSTYSRECNGNGICENGSCICETGYLGDYCESCDQNFQDNDSDGVCLPACTHEDACQEPYECSDIYGVAECECQVFSEDNQNGMKSLGVIGSSIKKVVAVDGILYAAAGNDGLRIFKVIGNQPVPIGQFEVQGETSSVFVKNGIAYFSDSELGLIMAEISNFETPVLLGQYPVAQAVQDIFVQDGLAFVASGYGGVEIVDVSDVYQPVKLGEIELHCSVHKIEVSGYLAFAVCLDDLYILDISETTSPEIVKKITARKISDAVVFDDYLVTSNLYDGIKIYDVSTPSEPELLGRYDELAWYTYGISVVDGLLYASVSSDGLQILDISDPANIKVLGELETPGYAKDVAVLGSKAIVAEGASGLQVVDVANPALPKLLDRWDSHGKLKDIVLRGDLLLAVDYLVGLVILDMQNPSRPVIVGKIELPGVSAMDISGSLAHFSVRDGSYFSVDISDPSDPVIVGTYIDDSDWFSDYLDIAVYENNVVLVDDFGDVIVLDVSDPAYPELVSEFYISLPEGIERYKNVVYINTLSYGVSRISLSKHRPPRLLEKERLFTDAHDICFSNNTAYVSKGYYGLEIYDMTTIDHPVLVGTYTPPYFQYIDSVAVNDGKAFLDVSNMIRVLDISDKNNIVILGDYSLFGKDSNLFDGYIYDITVDKNKLYARTSKGTFIMQSMNNIGSSYDLLGHVDTEDNPYDAYLVDQTAYVADFLGGLLIFDVSDPSEPVLLGNLSTNNATQGVSVMGNIAYLTDGYGDFKIVDVSDPSKPTLMSRLSLSGYAYEVAISGNLAYIASGQYRFHIVDISDPYDPVAIGNGSVPGFAQDIFVSGDVLYVLGYNDILHVFDVSDPTDPQPLSSYDPRHDTGKIFVQDSIAYLAAGKGGLHILDMSDPSEPELLSIFSTFDAQAVTVSHGIAIVADSDNGILLIDVSDPMAPVFAGKLDSGTEVIDVNVSGEAIYAFYWDGMGIFKKPGCECAAGYVKLGGSCEEALLATVDSIVISELMVKSQHLEPDTGEWIELTNPGDTPVSLEDCVIETGFSTVPVPGQSGIMPQERLILSNGGHVFETHGVEPDFVLYGLSLDDSGDTISLICDGVTIDSMEYTQDQVMLGKTISLNPDYIDAQMNDNPANWCVEEVQSYGDWCAYDLFGTPGEINEICGSEAKKF